MSKLPNEDAQQAAISNNGEIQGLGRELVRGDGSAPLGSRNKAPTVVQGNEVPQKMVTFHKSYCSDVL